MLATLDFGSWYGVVVAGVLILAAVVIITFAVFWAQPAQATALIGLASSMITAVVVAATATVAATSADSTANRVKTEVVNGTAPIQDAIQGLQDQVDQLPQKKP